MKVIIAGSRTITDCTIVSEAISKAGFDITEIVSGGAVGVDRCGEWYAAHHNIPIKRFLADWRRYGRKAGPIRNGQMADYADALVAVWDGASTGTKNMIELAERNGLKVFVHNANELVEKQ